jgi:hypothetical protein
LLVDTEIRNIERLIIGNLDESHTVIPTIYPRISRGQIAKTARRPDECFAMKHIGIGVSAGLMAMPYQDGVMRPKERPSSRVDWTKNRFA